MLAVFSLLPVTAVALEEEGGGPGSIECLESTPATSNAAAIEINMYS